MAKSGAKFGRRTLMSGGAGLAAAAVLARPNIARAADKTLDMWWNQGFYPAEDNSFKKIVDDWSKKSGIKVNLSMITGDALDQKVVSALTTGTVPDVIYTDHGPAQTLPQAAWNDKLVDVSDVVATQEKEYSKTALVSAQYYNDKLKKRSFYGVPLKAQALNIPIWKTLVEKAGYQMSDIPNTWDKFFAFFEPVQEKLRKKGMRHVYGLGYTVSTTGADPNNLFNQAMIAYGDGLVTPDGKLHTGSAKVQKAMMDTVNMLAVPYKKGFVPPSAINWADGDNNVAFHSKQVVMTPNDTISISTAIMKEHPDWYYHDIITHPMPHDNSGKPVKVMLSVPQAFIIKGAKNIDGAKDFLRELIVPTNLDNYLKGARARWLPVMPSIVKNDPYWTDKKDQHRVAAITQGVLGPTTPWPSVYNPAFAQCNAEYVWSIAVADVIHGMKTEDAMTKAFKHVEKIFSNFKVS